MDNYNVMYEKLPNLVFGFHGCNKDTYEKVLYKHKDLKKSDENPAVLGAIIDLGRCLNLTDDHTSSILRRGYEMLKIKCETTDNDMPQNRSGKSKTDILLRDLDCAVIQQIHEYNSETKQPGYDSVRGVFEEGEEVYPGSALREKTHIQLCIVNPNCIKGFFSPRKVNLEYTTP